MDSVSPCPQPSLPVHVADSVHESSVISLQPSDRMMAAAENAHLPVLALFKALTNSGNVGSMETLQRLSCSVTASSKASGGSPQGVAATSIKLSTATKSSRCVVVYSVDACRFR